MSKILEIHQIFSTPKVISPCIKYFDKLELTCILHMIQIFQALKVSFDLLYVFHFSVPLTVMKMKNMRVLLTLLVHITGLRAQGGQHDEAEDNSDNGGDDIDFTKAVLDPDTGLMCVPNQGTNLQPRSLRPFAPKIVRRRVTTVLTRMTSAEIPQPFRSI